MTRGRKPAPTPEMPPKEADDQRTTQLLDAVRETNQIAEHHQEQVLAVAAQLGYDGPLSVGALEDGIRFYQRRTVEALLETGKRLLLLKELTPHGEFAQRVEMLGISDRSAQRFMQAAAKTAKSAKLADLSGQIKSASAFLELVTHDDDALETLAELDDVDRMSASQLRAALREARADSQAQSDLLAEKNQRLDEARARLARVQKLPPDQVMAELRGEATRIHNDIRARLIGELRQALVAIDEHRESSGLPASAEEIFMAGLVGQILTDAQGLRDEFSLPQIDPDAHGWVQAKD